MVFRAVFVGLQQPRAAASLHRKRLCAALERWPETVLRILRPRSTAPVPPAGEEGCPEGLAPLALAAQARGPGAEPRRKRKRTRNPQRILRDFVVMQQSDQFPRPFFGHLFQLLSVFSVEKFKLLYYYGSITETEQREV